MFFYHALQINESQCTGCTRCMKVCPTEAIRIHNEIATISESRCIDCGKCFKICPSKAIYIKQDDFESIFNFPCRVALIPSVFLGQFPNDISVSRIYAILQEIGFTHVFYFYVSLTNFNFHCYSRSDTNPHSDENSLLSIVVFPLSK